MDAHPYDKLTPDLVIDAVESAGYLSDARQLALNSYENRVYQVGIEDDKPVIAKFYRPERWSEAQILEEHQFSLELQDADISVVAPLRNENGDTLLHYAGYMFAIFPRRGGHAPEFDNFDNLLILGRTLGRIHAVGRSRRFEHRTTITVEDKLTLCREYLLEHHIPPSLAEAYSTITHDINQRVVEIYQAVAAQELIRVHGDCHGGNILWRDDVAHFVDLDDCCMAPAIQDLWMFLSGDRNHQQLQLAELIEGYNEFCDFQPKQLRWIEALRSMRMVHYAAWLARRWTDPAFPRSFTWFNTERYWGDHILQLREQLSALQEEPLKLL